MKISWIQAYFTGIKKIFNSISNQRVKASLLILAIAMVLSLSEALRIYVINVNYSTPSYLRLYLLLLEYNTFAVLPLFIDWCWGQKGISKYVRVTLISVVFTLIYLGIMSGLEWVISATTYNFSNGFLFTLIHSGPKILMITALIFIALIVLKVPKTKVKTFIRQLQVKDKKGSYFIDVRDIICMESNDNYVILYLEGDNSCLVRQTLRKLEKTLDPQTFQRIHRKFIINTTKVDSWKPEPAGGYMLVLDDRYEVKMSKSYKHKLPQIIAQN